MNAARSEYFKLMGIHKLDAQGEPVRVTVEEMEDLITPDLVTDPRRIVAKTRVGNVEVNTCFLIYDLSASWAHAHGEPVLWETMLIPDFDYELTRDEADLQRRCGGKRADALAMHEAVVAELTATARRRFDFA